MSDRKKIQEEVDKLGALQAWNHNFELPYGVQTRPGAQQSQGKNLVKLNRLIPIFELIGLENKKILDVGCNEGFFSAFMAVKGAYVTGVDVDELRISKAKYIQKIIKGIGNVNFRKVDIYSQEFTRLPYYDLCLCLGFIHRVPDPFRAVQAISEHSDMIVFEWKALKFGPHNEAFAYFSPKAVDVTDFYGTEYWLLSYTALERLLARVGFKYFYRVDDPRQKRAILVAGKHHHKIFDEPNIVIQRGRVRTLFSHSKRFILSLVAILLGRINS